VQFVFFRARLFILLMMHPKKYLAFFFALIVFVAACGGPAERIRETAAKSPTPPPAPTEREISGTFNVGGSGGNGSEPYTGLLTIAPQGDVYGFRWSTTKGSRVGVGVQSGSATAASFASTGGGKGCGVLLFKIASDGSLDGKIAYWGGEKSGLIKATRTEGRGFVGKYSIAGNVPGEETPFAGQMSIAKDGQGYAIDWLQDYEQRKDESFVAFGIWKGSVAAASFGGRQCSFALYDIQSNGNLEGNWGGQKAVTFGTETAKRQ
jgi:hypothetical protein